MAVRQARAHIAVADVRVGTIAATTPLAHAAAGANLPCGSKVDFHVNVVFWLSELQRCVLWKACIGWLAWIDEHAKRHEIECPWLFPRELVHEKIEVGVSHRKVQVFQGSSELAYAAASGLPGVVVLKGLDQVV